ncbi:hypothetical protein E1212_19360 [Jiangella ureilytica]|uniref:Uncharacterized protein n=1 Tax=Jiangella ureilytica TaxID=2530374 RepID=A0A4R4RHV3_9ACTN|nr:hypothetical protein [Jiangella ureilytica]TDC49017.1 hypothetical protein E1212_19360 [Jiangella ureilytica]
MTADLEFGAVGDHGTAARTGQGAPAGQGGAGRAAGPAGQPARSPAMRAYCATLARFTSSVQSTEQLLRNDDAGTREDTEQRELTATSRLRGIDRAALAADDGLDHCAAVRAAHGLPLPPATWGTEADLALPDPADDDLDARGPGPGEPGRARLRGHDTEPADDGRHPAGSGTGRGPRPATVSPAGLARLRPPGHGTEPDDHSVPSAQAGNGYNPRTGEPGRARPLGHDTEPADDSGRTAHPGNGHTPRTGEPGRARPLGHDTEPADDSGRTAHAGNGRVPRSGTAGPGGLDRLRRSGGGADLGVALTSLGRRRDALRLAEEEFAGWLAARDEQTRRVSLGAAVGAGLAGAAVMVVAGTRTSAAVSLALLAACTLVVVAVGVGVAAARRSPRVCRGAGLARRPHPLGLARYAAQIGGPALLALAAANIGAGAL